MTKLSWICFVVLFAFAFSTCDENGGKGGGGVSEVIGPEGGTITSRDGRLTLTFPPGALSEDTEITIRDIDPNELPPEFDELDPDLAYLLEPDGIVFAVPVTATLMLDDEPVQDDGSLSALPVLLLTSSDGALEILDNLTQDVEGDANTAMISGELNHFSLLSDSKNGVRGIVEGVPDSLPIGESFVAHVLINTGLGEFTDFGQLYQDFSQSPVNPPPLGPVGKNLSVAILTHDEASGSFTYTCSPGGTGIYKSRIFYDVKTKGFMSISRVMGTLNFSKPVTCVGDVPPPPMEVCAKVGSYNSQSPGCGIGTFTITDITSGELTVTGFGTNPGDVKFMQLPLEPTVFSSTSDNLIIFDKNGHSCTLTCGPGEGELTLDCENPPNMCTEVFTLQ